MIDSLNFDKLRGLIPAVIQHESTGEVLMVGFMNRDAVTATLRDRMVTFWSRSRQSLWRKGETSGHTLTVVDMTPDCDQDALLIRARPHGPTCHTGTSSCFFGGAGMPFKVLADLQEIIQERKAAMPEGSYTSTLFKEGTARIAQKVGEEGVETALAGAQGDSAALTREAADLIYHLTVLLTDRGVLWEEVFAELRQRMNKRQ